MGDRRKEAGQGDKRAVERGGPAAREMGRWLLRSASFKEDSYVAAALPLSELRALADLKALLARHPGPISIWGVPLNNPHQPPPAAADGVAAAAPPEDKPGKNESVPTQPNPIC